VDAGQRMFADVSHVVLPEIRIVYWKGGISIWAPGPVVTRDGDGNELHRLN
ncbi:MAG: hypothetical protein QOH14_881, partial [Pseudonocardiales bacterium]|nr:hypothetical protein [Pseudonocardiales bacterium]